MGVVCQRQCPPCAPPLRPPKSLAFAHLSAEIEQELGHHRRSLARDSLGVRTRPRRRSLPSLRPPSNGVPLIPLRGRIPPPCAAPRASYVMPSYSPTVSRSAWERTFEFPPGAPPGYLGAAARAGRWASGTPGAGRRVGRGHRRARRAERARACAAAHPGHRAASVFRPGCALAWAHEVASGTGLVVLAHAVTMACGVWRAAAAEERRVRATVGFGVSAGGSAGAVRRAVRVYRYP